MEKIISIEAVNDKVGHYSVSGYKIVTDIQVITLLVENEQNCCENWGYLMTEDDFSDYIGAGLINVTETDENLFTKEAFPSLSENEASTIFVNIETTKGTLQFVAYNEHNGYYSHKVFIKSDQLTKTDSL